MLKQIFYKTEFTGIIDIQKLKPLEQIICGINVYRNIQYNII